MPDAIPLTHAAFYPHRMQTYEIFTFQLITKVNERLSNLVSAHFEIGCKNLLSIVFGYD